MKIFSSHHFYCLVIWCIAPFFAAGQTVGHVSELLNRAEEERHNDRYLDSYATIDSALQLGYITGDKKTIANCLSEKGVAAMYLGRYGKALDALQKGLIIREQISDSVGMQESFNYIATIHHAQSDYDLAKYYYSKSLGIAERTTRKRKLAVLQNNLGVLAEDQGNFLEALNFHSESLSLWEAMNDTAWISVSLRHIGKCYSQQGQLLQALVSYEKAYELSKQSGSSHRNVARVAVSLGELKLKMGDFKGAREWCQGAYDLSSKHNILVGIQESSECLTVAHEELGNHLEALKFYKLSQRMRDSIYGNERMKELTQLELNFQFEKEQLADSLEFVKTTLIQDKKISNQRIGLVGIGAVTLSMFLLALVVYYGKRKSDSLLLNILPAQVASELKKSGQSKAKRLDNVTVLFTDFKGFTTMSEVLPPEELVAEIHHCFSAFDAIMSKYQVEKIKTIGDAYMAAGGIPVPRENTAKDVVSAAIEMRDFMKKRAEELAEKGRMAFEMRIGIHTGTVVAGIVGTKKFQYDIWGDAVNTAARMESSGMEGKINISNATYELVKNDFNCLSRGKITAKGKGEMEMYFVEPNELNV